MEPTISSSPTSPVAEPGANLSRPMLIGGIVLAVIVLAALYFWQQPAIDQTRANNAESWMPATTDSDDAAAIQAELEATNMSEFENTMQTDADAAASGL